MYASSIDSTRIRLLAMPSIEWLRPHLDIIAQCVAVIGEDMQLIQPLIRTDDDKSVLGTLAGEHTKLEAAVASAKQTIETSKTIPKLAKSYCLLSQRVEAFRSTLQQPHNPVAAINVSHAAAAATTPAK